MQLAGFEPTISAGERPQTHSLDRAATGTGNEKFKDRKYFQFIIKKRVEYSHVCIYPRCPIFELFSVSHATKRPNARG